MASARFCSSVSLFVVRDPLSEASRMLVEPHLIDGTGGDQLHVMVADVIKSFDTVDRSILDCSLGRQGLPDWFRRAYFLFIVRCVSGSSCTRIILSVVLRAPGPFLVRLHSLRSMSGRSVRMSLLVSVFFLAFRKSMKLWDVSGDDMPWNVKPDVRDLGGHLDFTRRARAGTLSQRVRDATHGVAAVGALLPMVFRLSWA